MPELEASPYRFPEVLAGWFWLEEMAERVDGGVPPVTEEEFAELAAWLDDNHQRLWDACQPSQLLDVGGGRRRPCADLRYGAARGPRAKGAGELAQDLRLLRARAAGAAAAPGDGGEGEPT
jgi:hypothetical protein